MKIGDKEKIEGICLKKLGANSYQVSWWVGDDNPRKRFRATTDKEARQHAAQVGSSLKAGRAYNNPTKPVALHSISEAVGEAIGHSTGNDKTKSDYMTCFNQFVEYATETQLKIAYWNEVTPNLINNYIAFCRKQDKRHDTIRQRVYVLRMTSAYMSRTYPDDYRDFSSQVKLKKIEPSLSEEHAHESILKADEYIRLLRFLNENDRMVYTWALLQGLCGLRVWEAAYLKEDDVNVQARTITIRKNEAHTPKNRHSYRTIPVPLIVADALADFIRKNKVRHHLGFIFHPSRTSGRAKSAQTRLGLYGAYGISQRWERSLKAARDLNLPAYFTGRKLRASFATMLRMSGVDYFDLQRYLGHAPKTILSAHYDVVDAERLQRIADAAHKLYEGSTAKVLQSPEKAIL